ncbi:heavy-metal-associated domain-containing protein [Microbacterium hominis]|uniref:heavy-metal-associated domain-containing protein n=1 Tax=Microbacterium hominis TaxID=162426 RepID=UPI000768692D|nr:heavy-metal-associated domain-containing protein [Microbacterium hominis]KXC06134.1 cation-transporting ATPase [Microbacterium hominis]
MSTQTYAVDGMTCAHCAGAVTREVRKVDGIDDIAVDVTAGTLTVTVDDGAAGAALDAEIAAAVEEAGYTVVAR